MHEKIHDIHEHKKHQENAPAPEKLLTPEPHGPAAETAETKDKDSIEQIKQRIEQEATSSKDIAVEQAPETSSQQFFMNKELKAEALQKTFTRVRKHLSLPQKAFSQVIHQPIVDTISNIGAKTIARPSGLLTGGLIALLGSFFALYTTKRYGFSYNFTLFFLLFFMGYLLGIMIEGFAYLLRRNRNLK